MESAADQTLDVLLAFGVVLHKLEDGCEGSRTVTSVVHANVASFHWENIRIDSLAVESAVGLLAADSSGAITLRRLVASLPFAS